MSLQLAAQHLAQHGRGDDKMLVHMTPKEVSGLQQLAQMHGGSLTRNPHTGLPEAGFLDSLLPTIIGGAAMVLSDGAVQPWMIGLGVGGVEAARTGSLSKGLMAGLGAYGGAGLAGGLMGAGAAAEGLGAQAAANTASEASGLTGAASDAAQQQAVADKMASLSNYDKFTSGLQGLGNEQGRDLAVNALGGGMGAVKTGLAAAAPVFANQMVQTTTAPPASRSAIHPFMYDPGGGYVRLNSISPAENFKGFASGGIADDNSQSMFNYAQMQPAVDLHPNSGVSPQNMASGGVARYDDGGNINSDYTPQQIADYISQNNLSGDSLAAAEQQFGVTPDQVSYAQAQAAPAASTPALFNASAPVTSTASTTPAYTSYTPDQISQYVQQSGINLNDPAAIAAAEAQSNIDPAAYNAWFSSGANPFSAAALSNPTAANVSAFDATLGTAPANMDINNAIATAYKNTGATENLAGNIQGNTQLAREMDTWNVPPAQMAKETNHTEAEIQALYDAVDPNGKYASKAVVPTVVKPTTVIPGSTQLPNATTYDNGAYGNYGSGNQTGVAASGNVVSTATPGDIITNPNKSVSVVPNVPGRPYGGFTGAGAVTDAYTAGGGHTGPTNLYVPKSVEELNAKYPVSGGSQQMLDYLSGKTTENPILQPYTPTGQISKDYASSVAGYPAQDSSQKMYTFDAATKKYIRNPDFIPYNFDPVTGEKVYSKSLNQIRTDFSKNANMSDADWLKYITDNNIQPQQIADATNVSLGEVLQHIQTAKASASNSGVGNAVMAPNDGGGGGEANGGIMHAAMGGAMYSSGGIGDLGSYSDGGRLLRGPGDGVSDSIPATIGQGKPARLADGEFVVPARIVSELGNGSTEAGARKLYAMMDRVQNTRGETIGKGKVATNTRADKFLPA